MTNHKAVLATAIIFTLAAIGVRLAVGQGSWFWVTLLAVAAIACWAEFFMQALNPPRKKTKTVAPDRKQD